VEVTIVSPTIQPGSACGQQVRGAEPPGVSPRRGSQGKTVCKTTTRISRKKKTEGDGGAAAPEREAWCRGLLLAWRVASHITQEKWTILGNDRSGGSS